MSGCYQLFIVFGNSQKISCWLRCLLICSIFRSTIYCFPSPCEARHDTTAVVKHNSCCSFEIPLPRRRLSKLSFISSLNVLLISVSSLCRRFKQVLFSSTLLFAPTPARQQEEQSERCAIDWNSRKNFSLSEEKFNFRMNRISTRTVLITRLRFTLASFFLSDVRLCCWFR